MKITSYRSICSAWGPGPSIEVNDLFKQHFSWLIFFLSILCVKTGELKANYRIVIEKWYNRCLPLLTMPLPDLHRAGPPAVLGFLQHLSAKYRRRPKKVLRFERRAPNWYCAILWSIRPWLMHFVHKKAI